MKEHLRKNMIKELKDIYTSANFEFLEERDSIQLLYDDESLYDDEDFFDTVCNVALRYLKEDELCIFSVLYDCYNEMTQINIEGNVQYNSNSNYEIKKIGKELSEFAVSGFCDCGQDWGELVA